MSMMLTGWDPWGELQSLHSTMDRIFGQVFGGSAGRNQTEEPRFYLPVNLVENPTGYELEAPVPGFRPEEIDVTFTDGVLTIKAERRPQEHEQRSEETQYLRREFSRGSYIRQLTLPGEINPDTIQASVDHGLLTVQIPKAPSAQPKRIQISSGGASKAKLVGSSSS